MVLTEIHRTSSSRPNQASLTAARVSLHVITMSKSEIFRRREPRSRRGVWRGAVYTELADACQNLSCNFFTPFFEPRFSEKNGLQGRRAPGLALAPKPRGERIAVVPGGGRFKPVGEREPSPSEAVRIASSDLYMEHGHTDSAEGFPVRPAFWAIAKKGRPFNPMLRNSGQIDPGRQSHGIDFKYGITTKQLDSDSRPRHFVLGFF